MEKRRPTQGSKLLVVTLVIVSCALVFLTRTLSRTSRSIVPFPETWSPTGVAWTPRWNAYFFNEYASVWDINPRAQSDWIMRGNDLIVAERDYAAYATDHGIGAWPYRVTRLGAAGEVTSSPAMPPAGYPLLVQAPDRLWAFSQATGDSVQAQSFDPQSLEPLTNVSLQLRKAPYYLPSASVIQLISVTSSGEHCTIAASQAVADSLEYQGQFELGFDLATQQWNAGPAMRPLFTGSLSQSNVLPPHQPIFTRQSPLMSHAVASDRLYWLDDAYPALLLELQTLNEGEHDDVDIHRAATDVPKQAVNDLLAIGARRTHGEARDYVFIDEVLIRDPGETVASPLSDDTAQALRATRFAPDQALHVFALDSGAVLIAQLIYYTPKAVNEGNGIMRLGSRKRGQSTVDWYGWCPLPMTGFGFNGLSALEIYAGPKEWQVVLIGNACDPTSEEWSTQCNWTQIPIPENAPSPHGVFLSSLDPHT